jgi:hypothetical protein
MPYSKKIFTAGQGDWRNPKSRAQKDSPHGVRAIRSDPRLNYPRSLLGFSNLGRDCARNRQRSKHRFALLQGGTRRTQPLLSPFDDPDGRDLQNNEPRSAPPRRTGGAYSQLIATWLPGGSVRHFRQSLDQREILITVDDAGGKKYRTYKQFYECVRYGSWTLRSDFRGALLLVSDPKRPGELGVGAVVDSSWSAGGWPPRRWKLDNWDLWCREGLGRQRLDGQRAWLERGRHQKEFRFDIEHIIDLPPGRWDPTAAHAWRDWIRLGAN